MAESEEAMNSTSATVERKLSEEMVKRKDIAHSVKYVHSAP